MSNMPTPTDVATAIFAHKNKVDFDSFWDDRGMPSPLGFVICDVVEGNERWSIANINHRFLWIVGTPEWSKEDVSKWATDFNTLACSFLIQDIVAHYVEIEEGWSIALQIV